MMTAAALHFVYQWWCSTLRRRSSAFPSRANPFPSRFPDMPSVVFLAPVGDRGVGGGRRTTSSVVEICTRKRCDRHTPTWGPEQRCAVESFGRLFLQLVPRKPLQDPSGRLGCKASRTRHDL